MHSQICVARVREEKGGKWKRCVMVNAHLNDCFAISVCENPPRVIEEVWDYVLVPDDGCFWVSDPEAEFEKSRK